eukprot:6216708-Pyramimonas_sp.AAC.1
MGVLNRILRGRAREERAALGRVNSRGEVAQRALDHVPKPPQLANHAPQLLSARGAGHVAALHNHCGLDVRDANRAQQEVAESL